MSRKQSKVYLQNGNKNSVYSIVEKMTKKYRESITEDSLKDLYTLEWKGHEFNALPFLVNGVGYLNVRFEEQVLGLIVKYGNRTYIEDDTFYAKNPYIDSYVIDSLLHSYNDRGRLLLTCYAMTLDAVQVSKFLYHYYSVILADMVRQEYMDRIVFQDRTLANTQSFCYHLGAYWVLKKSPVIRTLAQSDLQRIDLEGIIHEAVPNDCPLDRFLKGEITSKELADTVVDKTLFSDNTNIKMREVLSITNEGDYDGSYVDEQRACLCDDVLGLLFQAPLHTINEKVGYCYLTANLFETTKKELNVKDTQLDRLQKCLDYERKKYNDKQFEYTEKCNENKALQSKILNLKSELSKHVNDSDLLDQIENLKKQVSSLKDENSQLLRESLNLKRNLSVKTKEVKKLTALLNNCKITEEEIEKEDSVGVSFEEMVNFVKNKSIVMCGLNYKDTITKKLFDYGITKVKIYDEKECKMRGNYDIGVILTQYTSHALVFKLENLMGNNPIIYFNGSNVVNLITEIYNEFKSV